MIRAFAAAQGHHASVHLGLYASWLVGHLCGVVLGLADSPVIGRAPTPVEGPS